MTSVPDNPKPLLERLVAKGDAVSIDAGVLTITPASGLDVPKDWLKENGPVLTKEICRLLNRNLYRYIDHSTGFTPKFTNDRLTLSFQGLLNGTIVTTNFNISIKRSRKSKKHIKGGRMASNRFTCRKKSHFWRFLLSTGMKMPRYPSESADTLHRLKKFLFEADAKPSNTGLRFNNDEIVLANISAETIFNALQSRNLAVNSSLNNREDVVNDSLNNRENVVNDSREEFPSSPYKSTPVAESNYERRQVRNKNEDKSEKNQGPSSMSVEQWRDDYGNEAERPIH